MHEVTEFHHELLGQVYMHTHVGCSCYFFVNYRYADLYLNVIIFVCFFECKSTFLPTNGSPSTIFQYATLHWSLRLSKNN